jgi:hypothetical protein
MKTNELTIEELNSLGTSTLMNMLIAEHVMGWKWHKHPTENIEYFRPDGIFKYGAIRQGDYVDYTDQLPNYSGNIKDAFQVIDRMVELHYRYELRGGWHGSSEHVAMFDDASWADANPLYKAYAETLSLAICRAALLAMMDK